MYFLRLTKACLFHEVFQGKVKFFFSFLHLFRYHGTSTQQTSLTEFFLLIQHLEKSEMLSYICFQNIQFVQNTTSKDYGQQMDTDTDKDRNTYSSPLISGEHIAWPLVEAQNCGWYQTLYILYISYTYIFMINFNL